MLWRQMTTALRTSKSLFAMLAVVIVVLAGVAAVIDAEHQHIALASLTGPGIFFTFFLITITRFDFRADLDQLEWLKMLPISPRSLVVGQLLTPIIVLSAVQWIVLMVIGLAFGYWSVLAIGGAFLLPLNIVLVGVENALFLVYPTRQMAAGLGDLQAVGRNMVLFLVRAAAVVIWGGVAAGLGAAAMALTGGSWTAFAITCWIVMAVTSLAVVPATALAFDRFDVSTHMPD